MTAALAVLAWLVVAALVGHLLGRAVHDADHREGLCTDPTCPHRQD